MGEENIVNKLDDIANGQVLDHYVGGWGTSVSNTPGSKNIPWLKFAADILRAEKIRDDAKLDEMAAAFRSFCNKSAPPFYGEEYSSVYTKWIVVPFDIARTVFAKRGYVEEVALGNAWLRAFVAIEVLGSSRGSNMRVSNWGKYPNTLYQGVLPSALRGGSRSWAAAKIDGSRKTGDKWNHIIWESDPFVCSLLWFWLGNLTSASQVRGDSVMEPVLHNYYKRFNPPHFLSEEEKSMLNYLHQMDAWDTLSSRHMEQVENWILSEGFTLPVSIDIIKTKTACLVVYGRTFHNGSTCTTLVHRHDNLDRGYVHGGCTPQRNNDQSIRSEIIKDPSGYMVRLHSTTGPINMVGDDRKTRKNVTYVDTPWWPKDGLVYHMRLEAGKISYLENGPPPVDPGDDPGDDGDLRWYEKLWKYIKDLLDRLF